MALEGIQDTPGRAPLRLVNPDCHSHLELAREAVAFFILMLSISVCVCPSAPSLCCREASKSHPIQTWRSRIHRSIRLRCVVAHLVNPIGKRNTGKATNHSFRLLPSLMGPMHCASKLSTSNMTPIGGNTKKHSKIFKPPRARWLPFVPFSWFRRHKRGDTPLSTAVTLLKRLLSASGRGTLTSQPIRGTLQLSGVARSIRLALFASGQPGCELRAILSSVAFLSAVVWRGTN